MWNSRSLHGPVCNHSLPIPQLHHRTVPSLTRAMNPDCEHPASTLLRHLCPPARLHVRTMQRVSWPRGYNSKTFIHSRSSWPLVAFRRLAASEGALKQDSPAVLWKVWSMFHLLKPNRCKLITVSWAPDCARVSKKALLIILVTGISHLSDSATPSRDSWIKFNKCPLASDQLYHLIKEGQTELSVLAAGYLNY